MPSTNSNDPSSPFLSFSRSIFSHRRENLSSIENSHETSAFACDLELESFQRRVRDRLQELSSVCSDELLSIEWIVKLLDVYISLQEEFRVILRNKTTQFLKPPLNHLVREFFGRSLKALDICNASRDGIGKMRSWKNHLDIVLSALGSRQSVLSKGQVLRARKALTDLIIEMLDDKESDSVFSHRNRSFGRNNRNKERHNNALRHSRSLSWSVSRSWSAAKQLQSIANNLVLPRDNELAVTLFTVSSVLIFVLWALVAALPCQDRGINLQFSFPRSLSWGVLLLSLHDRIVEESKKKDRQNSNGLLKEIHQIEKCVNYIGDLVDLPEFPLTEELKRELEHRTEELASVCEDFTNGLNPLERQVREVFHRIMSFRNEGLQVLGRANDTSE